MKSNRTLLWVAILLMVFAVGMSFFTAWFVINTQKNDKAQYFEFLKQELSKHDFDNSNPQSVDEAQISLSVAKYCESRNDCKGPGGGVSTLIQMLQPTVVKQEGVNGINGSTPACYYEDSQCRGENGNTPACYYEESQCQGGNGSNGSDGRTLEEQCFINDGNRYIGQRYVGTETWQVKYYLSEGQRCPEEVQ